MKIASPWQHFFLDYDETAKIDLVKFYGKRYRFHSVFSGFTSCP